jgi:hypothetical protein
MGQDIEITESSENVMSLADVKQHIQAIQAVLKGAMKEGVHYGTIPGTKGPSLWKAGAELIFATFRLGTQPTIEETGDGYRVTVRVFHIPTGNTIGYGMGSASWGEEKYAWRKALAGEFDAAEVEDRRMKYGRSYTVQQIRTNPCDLQNTVLKMAVKRARVDACLTCTAASDVFEQDLETVPRDELGSRNGNGAPASGNGNGGSSSEPVTDVDEAKILVAVESAKNADELIVVFDAINEIRNAKLKVSLMGAYKVRLKELGPEAVE